MSCTRRLDSHNFARFQFERSLLRVLAVFLSDCSPPATNPSPMIQRIRSGSIESDLGRCFLDQTSPHVPGARSRNGASRSPEQFCNPHSTFVRRSVEFAVIPWTLRAFNTRAPWIVIDGLQIAHAPTARRVCWVRDDSAHLTELTTILTPRVRVRPRSFSEVVQAFILLTASSVFATTMLTLGQHVLSRRPIPVGPGISGNVFRIPLPNAVGAGNYPHSGHVVSIGQHRSHRGRQRQHLAHDGHRGRGCPAAGVHARRSETLAQRQSRGNHHHGHVRDRR